MTNRSCILFILTIIQLVFSIQYRCQINGTYYKKILYDSITRESKGYGYKYCEYEEYFITDTTWTRNLLYKINQNYLAANYSLIKQGKNYFFKYQLTDPKDTFSLLFCEAKLSFQYTPTLDTTLTRELTDRGQNIPTEYIDEYILKNNRLLSFRTEHLFTVQLLHTHEGRYIDVNKLPNISDYFIGTQYAYTYDRKLLYKRSYVTDPLSKKGSSVVHGYFVEYAFEKSTGKVFLLNEMNYLFGRKSGVNVGYVGEENNHVLYIEDIIDDNTIRRIDFTSWDGTLFQISHLTKKEMRTYYPDMSLKSVLNLKTHREIRYDENGQIISKE